MILAKNNKEADIMTGTFRIKDYAGKSTVKLVMKIQETVLPELEDTYFF
ncbi:MAG: hypothetical protein WCQ54_08945 [Clostridiaceae bacterium]